MAQYEDSEFKILQLVGMHPAVFGETYVVAVGIHVSGPYYKGEYHILSQLPQHQIESRGWRFDQNGAPPDLLTVDLEFMLGESIAQAKNRLIDRLAERARELNADRLSSEQVTLTESTVEYFKGCWVRGLFNAQLIDLGSTTECLSLHRYLHALRQITPIQRG